MIKFSNYTSNGAHYFYALNYLSWHLGLIQNLQNDFGGYPNQFYLSVYAIIPHQNNFLRLIHQFSSPDEPLIRPYERLIGLNNPFSPLFAPSTNLETGSIVLLLHSLNTINHSEIPMSHSYRRMRHSYNSMNDLSGCMNGSNTPMNDPSVHIFIPNFKG